MRHKVSFSFCFNKLLEVLAVTAEEKKNTSRWTHLYACLKWQLLNGKKRNEFDSFNRY